MIQVRDRLISYEYKGRPTLAVDTSCPCRECYNPHDCGYRAQDGKWIEQMQCVTNYNKGCPSKLPDPIHIVKNLNLVIKGVRKCFRCGLTVNLERDVWVV